MFHMAKRVDGWGLPSVQPTTVERFTEKMSVFAYDIPQRVSYTKPGGFV